MVGHRVCVAWTCNLQIRCTQKTPVREMLSIWPTLPIVISGRGNLVEGVGNIIAALEYHDRICRITLRGVSNLLLEGFSAALQEPLPALTSLVLWSNSESTQVVPDSFWVEPQHVSKHSGWILFDFQDYRNYFCRPITSFFFTCGIFRIPDTFRPK